MRIKFSNVEIQQYGGKIQPCCYNELNSFLSTTVLQNKAKSDISRNVFKTDFIMKINKMKIFLI